METTQSQQPQKHKIVALISGGKDSIFNILKCIQNGHELVALANLYSENQGKEIDSFMYQSVGQNIIETIAQALDKPLFRRQISGKPIVLNLEYTGSNEEKKNDEVEDLYELLKEIKGKYPDITGVSSGAIASTYQKLRVEDICKRLGMESIAYLWGSNQEELIQDMIDNQMESIIIKTASYGLKPSVCLGKKISELKDIFLKLNKEHGFNICGEGGEYETLTLDCPIYKKKIVLQEYEIIEHSKDDFAPVSYLKIHKCELVNKQ